MRQLSFFLCVLILSLNWNLATAWCASQIIEADGYYCMGDNDTRAQAKAWALQDAKRVALEKAGTYLKSQTQVVNGQVTKDEILAIASGLIKLEKMLKEDFRLDSANNQIIKVKAKFSIDNSDLQKQIAQLKSSEQGQEEIQQLADLQTRYNQLLAENKSLKEKLTKAKDAGQRQQLEQKSKELQSRFSASQHLEQGNEYYGQGDYQAALESYNQAIKLDPLYAKAYYNRGLAYGALNNYQMAIEQYSKSIQISPKSSMVYNNRGIIYYNLKRYQEALVDYDKCLTLSPNNSVAYNNRAVLYNELGNYEKALSDYNEAISRTPENAWYYNNRGNVYRNLKRYEEAVDDYSKAIYLSPGLAYIYVNRGFAYDALGEIEKAKMDFQSAIRIGLNSEIFVKIPQQYRF